MLNEERIKLMTKMACYESNEGKKVLRLEAISEEITSDCRLLSLLLVQQ